MIFTDQIRPYQSSVPLAPMFPSRPVPLSTLSSLPSACPFSSVCCQQVPPKNTIHTRVNIFSRFFSSNSPFFSFEKYLNIITDEERPQQLEKHWPWFWVTYRNHQCPLSCLCQCLHSVVCSSQWVPWKVRPSNLRVEETSPYKNTRIRKWDNFTQGHHRHAWPCKNWYLECFVSMTSSYLTRTWTCFSPQTRTVFKSRCLSRLSLSETELSNYPGFYNVVIT